MSANAGCSKDVATDASNQVGLRAAPQRFAFSEGRLSDLKPQGRTAYVYDAKCHGLAVRITGKAKSFCFYGRLHRRVVRITLGRVGRLALADARNAVGRIRGDAAKGLDVVASRKALATKNAKGELVRERFERFLAGDRHRPKTAKDYRSLWERHIAPTLGKKAVEEVAPADVQALHLSVANRVGRGKN